MTSFVFFMAIKSDSDSENAEVSWLSSKSGGNGGSGVGRGNFLSRFAFSPQVDGSSGWASAVPGSVR